MPAAKELNRWTVAIACIWLLGCGGSASTGRSADTNASQAPSAGEAPSDAQSAATGDIPDNQSFLTYADRSGGYSIRYPEGWTRSTARRGEIIFQNRANVIRVALSSAATPTLSSAVAELSQLRAADPTIVLSGAPQRVSVDGSPVVKLSYTRLSKADPVSGKRLALTIDRYEYARAGKVATVDLGTPKGVDNVDAYRMISRSFRWR